MGGRARKNKGGERKRSRKDSTREKGKEKQKTEEEERDEDQQGVPTESLNLIQMCLESFKRLSLFLSLPFLFLVSLTKKTVSEVEKLWFLLESSGSDLQ